MPTPRPTSHRDYSPTGVIMTIVLLCLVIISGLLSLGVLVWVVMQSWK